MIESVMDWDALRVLLAVAERGSLRAAALRLGVSQPTLGRRLEALEQDLGVALLVRHARGVTLTADGQAAVEAARAVADRLGSLERVLAGRATRVAGRVRVSCTGPVAQEILPPSLARLRADHPELGVDVVEDPLATDLHRRDADLAIRMFPPQQASLVARRVGSTCTRLYASRAYLARRGRPESLEDLARHDLIAPDRSPLFVSRARALGLDLDLAAFRTDSFAATTAWVRAGLAIGALLAAVADRDPDLVPLLAPVAEHPVWLVTHPDLFGSAPVRAVWDQLGRDLPAFFPASPSPVGGGGPPP